MTKNNIHYESPLAELMEIRPEGICTGSNGLPDFKDDRLIDDSDDYE